MALSDFQAERREVKVNGKVLFSVEGLSLETLALLVNTHMPDLEYVFGIVVHGEKADETFQQQIARVAMGMAGQAPGLVANIIAICSGEPLTDDLIKQARRLPFPAQVQAMEHIGSLTFEEAGGVKKAIESLMTLLARLRTKPLNSPTDQTTPGNPS
jgi:hypothetical protein